MHYEINTIKVINITITNTVTIFLWWNHLDLLSQQIFEV